MPVGIVLRLSYLATMRPYLVGVAGGTASGKTTLVRRLLEYAGESRAALVELDGYYRAQDHLDFSQRVVANYDHPDTFEFNLLVQHIQALRRDEAIECPVYDFAAHTRLKGVSRQVLPRPVVLIEGMLVLAIPEVSSLLDLGIFVDAADDLRLSRRLERDILERGRTREGVLAQWAATVHPMHIQFCEPSRSRAQIIVDGSSFGEAQVQDLWRTIWDQSVALLNFNP